MAIKHDMLENPEFSSMVSHAKRIKTSISCEGFAVATFEDRCQPQTSRPPRLIDGPRLVLRCGFQLRRHPFAGALSGGKGAEATNSLPFFLGY